MSSPAITQVTTTTTLTTTTETAAATSPVVAIDQPGSAGQGVQISGCVTGATGTGVTSVQVRVRAGSGTGGAIIASVLQEAQAASSFYSMAFQVVDNSIGVLATPIGNAQYTVTVQQVGATGNGS